MGQSIAKAEPVESKAYWALDDQQILGHYKYDKNRDFATTIFCSAFDRKKENSSWRHERKGEWSVYN